ncbi:hypothetical protein BH11MYX1_BH11MYX1_52270 [soil metagenome]
MRAAIASACLLGASTAHADSNDLVLSRLGTHVTDAAGTSTSTVGDNLAFRALASQLGTALAPHLLTPADSLGFSGFQMSVDYAATTIDRGADSWRVLAGADHPSSLQTVGFFARKGLWLPVPSFEVGAGAVHLVDSHLWTGQFYGKLALHEGYHDLPLPSFAVRGAVSRLMNQRELDLTTASLDLEVSKHLGIGGTWRLDPFAGWDLLMIIPRSEVINGTPNVDPLQPGNEADAMNNFVFKDQDTIYRNRFFLGAKFQYYVFELTLEAQFALAGTSVDDRAGTNAACTAMSTTSECDAKDTAKAQTTLAMSAGFDF